MRRIIVPILALAAVMGLLGGFCSVAFADGDPASDVLLYDSVFYPTNTGGTPAEEARLLATVKAADQAGFPIKVAIIGSSADLGTVTQLWGSPFNYSIYLGKELSLNFHGTLMVVMPQGYGLRAPTSAIPAGDRKWSLDVVAPGSDLTAGAITQIQRLTADNGISLPRNLRFVVPTATGGSTSAGPLVGFGVGLIAIAVAWAASLRLRPLRRRVIA